MNKLKVARSFSRAAESYDQAAWFQQQVGEQLLSLWRPYIRRAIGDTVVDLGCGTGYIAPQLKPFFQQSSFVGLDLAEGMLCHARQLNAYDDYICADAEALPLMTESIDHIYSNMSVQWCEQLPQLFNELYRVLKPGGQIAITSLGPDTLFELKRAWQQVDQWVHVNDFLPLSHWQQAMVDAGFQVIAQRVENPVLYYDDVYQLLRELKAIGAHNVNDGQRMALTGRRRLQKLLAAYESSKTQQGYPATYEMFYWVLSKP